MNCANKKRKDRKWHLRVFNALVGRFGPLRWWPGDTPFEICVGAILTQNTAWTNVEKAIDQLKANDALDSFRMHETPPEKLAQMIRSSGYYNQKSIKLKNFARFLVENFDGDILNMSRWKTERIRRELLALKGVGPETADSMILYALNRKVFVIDAYTKRIFSRKGVFAEDIAYEQARAHFEEILPRRVRLYNEFHAQIVKLGNNYCKKSRPLCDDCPIQSL